MKITFLLPHAGPSGGNKVVATYARILRQRGHDITILSQPLPEPTLRDRLRALLGRTEVPVSIQQHSFFDDLDISHLILDERRPPMDEDVPDADIIVATWWETAYWVAALSASKGRKFYLVQGHEVFNPLPLHFSRGSYYLPLRKIVVSEWLADVMKHEYDDSHSVIIHNSVDFEQFHAPARNRNPVPTVGLLYAHHPMKGGDIGLAALEAVLESVPDLAVQAFGHVPPPASTKLQRQMTFHRFPHQNLLREIYASCDIWLFPSRSEGFGLPILEAMACRTPVVATRAGAAPQLIDDGENGFLVSSYDDHEIAQRIIDVLNMPQEKWMEMSHSAYNSARSYAWDDATNILENLFMDSCG